MAGKNLGLSSPSLSIYSSLLVVFSIIGYFGVSDADVVLRVEDVEPNGPLLNHNVGHPSAASHAFRHGNNNNNNNDVKRNPFDGKETKAEGQNESVTIDESMWEQLVIRALANPTEWVQLRQALDKVDADLRSLTAMANSRQTPNSSKGAGVSPKWRFTYHRVTIPQFRNQSSATSSASTATSSNNISSKTPAPKGKAFAAISLANPTETEESSSPLQQQPPNPIQEKLNQVIKDRPAPPPMLMSHKLKGMYEADLQRHANPAKDTKSQWKTSENLSHYYMVVDEEEEDEDDSGEDDPDEQEKRRLSPKQKKKKEQQSQTVNLHSPQLPHPSPHQSPQIRDISPDKNNFGSKKHPSARPRGSSRLQLEREMAKMSSMVKSHKNDPKHPAFHWRPWIHASDVKHAGGDEEDHNQRGKTISPTPLSPPPPKQSLSSSTSPSHPLQHTWSEDLQSYHDQLHSDTFRDFRRHGHPPPHHQHHHHNHPHHQGKDLHFLPGDNEEDHKSSSSSSSANLVNGDTSNVIFGADPGILPERRISFVEQEEAEKEALLGHERLPSEEVDDEEEDGEEDDDEEEDDEEEKEVEKGTKKEEVKGHHRNNKEQHRQRHQPGHPGHPGAHVPFVSSFGNDNEAELDPVFTNHHSSQLEYRI